MHTRTLLQKQLHTRCSRHRTRRTHSRRRTSQTITRAIDTSRRATQILIEIAIIVDTTISGCQGERWEALVTSPSDVTGLAVGFACEALVAVAGVALGAHGEALRGSGVCAGGVENVWGVALDAGEV